MQELQELQDQLQKREQRLRELERQWKQAVDRNDKLKVQLKEAQAG
jgi:septal ring factor EnvC (AmiA/AmiB activator)